MEPENDGNSKRNLLFQGLLFRFHVKFQGCSQIGNLPQIGVKIKLRLNFS